MQENVKVKKLKNGFTLVFIPYKVDTVTACLRGLAGSNYEDLSEIGSAHILEHIQVLGSRNFSKENELQNIVLKNGGRITGTTSRDDVAFLVKTLKGNYRDGIKFLYELFAIPIINLKNFEIAKNSVKQEIYQNMDDPKRHIGRISYKILYPNQRFSYYNTGDIEQIDRLSLIDVAKFREKYYSPENFVLSICGNIKEQDFFNFAETLFSGIPKKHVNTNLTHQFNKTRALLIENRPYINQLHLKIDYEGFKTNQIEKYAAYILAKLFQAKIVNKLKNSENKINTYIVDTASFSSNSYGLFGLYTAIKPDTLKLFLSHYEQCVTDLIKNGVSDDEYDSIKNKVYADFVFTMEKTSLRADFYSELYLYDNVTKSFTEELNNYLNCSKEDIKLVAKKIFSQNPKFTIIDKNLTENEFMNYQPEITF